MVRHGVERSGHATGWATRLVALPVELALLVVGGAVVYVDSTEGELGLLALWDAIALVYLAVGMAVVRHQALHPRTDAAGAAPPRRWVGVYLAVFPVVVSLLGLTSAVTVILEPEGARGDVIAGVSAASLVKAVSAVAMVLAWLVLHVCYGRLYRWLYARDGGGLEFPGDAAVPSPVDFFYFAITLGATFATSDVNVTTSRMRWRVMVHTVVGFFYNTVVLAVGVRIITGG